MTGILIAMIGILLVTALALIVGMMLPGLVDAIAATPRIGWDHRWEILALLLIAAIGVGIALLHRRLRDLRSRDQVDLGK